MAEYIAREVLLAQLRAMESYNVSPMYRRGYDEAILKTPAADVVPVVRCKECKHLFYTMCAACGFLPHKPNDFCSYGERMDGGTGNAESVERLRLFQ